MAKFGARERVIAGVLSSMPGVKQFVKKCYVILNALIYRKKYRYKTFGHSTDIGRVILDDSSESFFGYYDKCPENGTGDIVMHVSQRNTSLLPDANEKIQIVIKKRSGEIKVIDTTSSYNWQQGARTHWLNDDLVIYNVYEDGQYKAKVYSLKQDSVVRLFDYPVQESHGIEFFLSINYRRIMYVRPDYGYRNMPPLLASDMKQIDNDGIWKLDYNTGKKELIHSLKDIVEIDYKPVFDECLHAVNHLMISPNGKDFIFVHRYYKGKRRYDRLMLSDFNSLKVLLDDEMVSHYCWIGNDEVFGYFRYDGKDGYYFCNVQSGNVYPCNELNDLQLGDGHPTYNGSEIIVDTYPDKSRMQCLMSYNPNTKEVKNLLEVYQGVNYMNQTRCDLHPRYSFNGEYVYFDSVFNNKRQLCKYKL